MGDLQIQNLVVDVSGGGYHRLTRALLLLLTSCALTPGGGDTPENVIRVPDDFPTIQQAIDSAGSGETILVSPGVYRENLRLFDKSVILASWYQTTRDALHIRQTILDGQGRESVIEADSVGPDTAIIGFTIRNATIGIVGRGEFQVLHNWIVDTEDGVLWRGGRGILRGNVVEDSRDDGIDLHGPTEMIIRDNLIRNSVDDGIEVRLNEYSGPFLEIDIRNNRIYKSGEHGIQLVDYPSLSSRVFRIQFNVIAESGVAGLRMMSRGPAEDFEGAGIPERVYLINNTFLDNQTGISGGHNVIALNNIIAGSRDVGISNMGGNSIGSHLLFWNNGRDYHNSHIESLHLLFKDPLLDEDQRPVAGGPVIDAGIAAFKWKSEIVLNLSPEEYSGGAPDVGAVEFGGPQEIVPGQRE